MPERIPKLSELCLKILRTHVASITDLGEAPFRLVQTLLLKMSADQLRVIESLSPQLAAESDGIWRALCLADYANLRDRYEHRPPTIPREGSWKLLYEAESRAEAARLKKARQHLKRQYSQVEEDKSANALVRLDSFLAGTSRRKKAVTSKPHPIMQRARSRANKLSIRPTLPEAPLLSRSPARPATNEKSSAIVAVTMHPLPAHSPSIREPQANGPDSRREVHLRQPNARLPSAVVTVTSKPAPGRISVISGSH